MFLAPFRSLRGPFWVPKVAPRRLPGGLQEASRRPPEAPRKPQGGPEEAPRCPKAAPRCPQEALWGPRTAPRAPKMPPRGFPDLPDHPPAPSTLHFCCKKDQHTGAVANILKIRKHPNTSENNGFEHFQEASNALFGHQKWPQEAPRSPPRDPKTPPRRLPRTPKRIITPSTRPQTPRTVPRRSQHVRRHCK